MAYPLDLSKRLRILKTLYWRRRPFVLIHRINLVCNCRCRACDWWKLGVEKREGELSLATLTELFREAGRLGMTDYNIYGGEPLLREDFPAVLAAAKNAGLSTSTTTNALLLEERAHEIAPHLECCAVSIDAIGEEHDKLRGIPGAFDRAVRGIEALKRTGRPVRLRFWTQIHRGNRHALAGVVELAREVGAEVEFVPTWALAGYNEDLVLSAEERGPVIDELKRLKRQGAPILSLFSSLEIMKTGRPFRCNMAAIAVTFDWDGRVLPCPRKVEEPVGWCPPLGRSRIADLISDPRFPSLDEQYRSCNECNVACAMATKDNLLMGKLGHLGESLYIQLSRAMRAK